MTDFSPTESYGFYLENDITFGNIRTEINVAITRSKLKAISSRQNHVVSRIFASVNNSRFSVAQENITIKGYILSK